MMPNLPYLYFLTNGTAQSYYLLNGVPTLVNINAVPPGVIPWLPQAPDGWLDTEVSFARNGKYYGINRSFVPPLKFAGDGATIIRSLFYGGLGVEATIFFVVVKLNPQTNVYEPYYRGELDLSKIDDSVADFCTVNVLESGVLKYLKANENNVYEIPCDGSLPEHISVYTDGRTLDNATRFAPIGIEYTFNSGNLIWTLGMVFLNSDGQSPNVKVATQNPESTIDPGTYFSTSLNYFYSSSAPSTIRLVGSLKFTRTLSGDTGPTNILIYFITSLGTKYVVYDSLPAGIPKDTPIIVNIDQTITLAGNENLFLAADWNVGNAFFDVFEFEETAITISYSARYQATRTYGFKPLDLWKILVSKVTEGQFTGESDLLLELDYLILTSGLAIRQIPAANIKTSITDFFTSFNAIKNCAIYPDGNTLRIERKRKVFNPDTVDMDLGEVSEMKVAIQADYFFNSISIGYANNEYDSSNGLDEWNTTAKWNAPITKIQKDLLLVSKYRADSYGIEFTRTLTPGNNTVNNKSDNDVFVLRVDPSADDPFTTTVSFIAALNAMIVPNNVGGRFVAGQTIMITGSASNDGTHVVGDTASFLFFGVIVAFTGGATVDEASVPVTIQVTAGALFRLYRPTYDSITGINHPEDAYNIEDLTPKRMLLEHGNYIRGVLFNRPDKNLSFLSMDKNKNLSTTLAGVSVVEATDENIGNLQSPLFYPYTVNFKTKVPITFEQLMTNAVNAHVKWLYNGKTFYGFPMQVSAKPTLDDAQEWTMILSPLTNVQNLINLDVNGLAFLEQDDLTMFIPRLSPVQFVKLGAVLPPQYHFKYMDQWWYSEQIKFYVEQPRYSQKWQNDDTIKLQVQTNGLGPIKAELINCHGEIVQTDNFVQKTDPAITSPIILWEVNMLLTGHVEGNYYILITAGTGDTVSQAISEPLHIAESHALTLLLQYYGTRNKQSTIFTTGYNPTFRFEGWLDEFEPGATFASYVDQPADIELLNGIPHRAYTLNVGNKAGVPDYVPDKVNRIMLIGIGNKTLIDGKQMSRNEDGKLEAELFPGTPLKYWKLKVRESVNADGDVIPTTGDLTGELTVEYNIKTIAFGDGSPDNIVQVTEVS